MVWYFIGVYMINITLAVVDTTATPVPCTVSDLHSFDQNILSFQNSLF